MYRIHRHNLRSIWIKILHGLHYQTENLIIDFTLLPYCFTFYKNNAVPRSFIICEDLLTHRILLPCYNALAVVLFLLPLYNFLQFPLLAFIIQV